jgi:hypothetical protein
LSAEWESVRCDVTPHEAGGNCVVCEDWVGSNPRRRNSLQDDEPVSAGWTGEPATAWRSPGLVGRSAWRAAVTRSPAGAITWLRAGCSEGKAAEAERPVRGERPGQESEPS